MKFFKNLSRKTKVVTASLVLAVLALAGIAISQTSVNEVTSLLLRTTNPYIRWTGVLDLESRTGLEVLKLDATTVAAVNEVTITSAATGTGPTIASTGGDTNVALNIASKGTGAINITAGSSGVQILGGPLGGFRRTVVSAASGTTALTVAQSGALVLNTGTGATTTFTLPAASTAGLEYCFVENGDAAGELLVGVQTGDNVVGRGITDTAGTGGATAIATTANTGIKNTAATNVKGDMACVTSNGSTTWVMNSVMGVWASQ